MDLSDIAFYPMEGQTFKFDYISIAFVVIILIAFIVNIRRGFIKALITLCAGLGSIILAFFLCKPIGNALSGTSLGNSLCSSIYGWTSTVSDGALNVTINTANQAELLPKAYSVLNIPTVLQDMCTNLITPLITAEGGELSSLIAQVLSNYTFIVGTFIVLWIVFLIIFRLIGKAAKGINKVPVIGFVNRLLGGVFGILIGLVICCVLVYGLSFFLSGNFEFGTTIADWMAIGDDSVWTFSKTLYNINIIQRLIDLYLPK